METQASQAPIPTTHALMRTKERCISDNAVEAALRHGHVYHVRGAAIHVLRRKDVMRLQQSGIDLAPYEGTQVVCSPGTAIVITVYRNRDLRGLRPRSRTMAGARRRKRATGVGN